MSNLNLDGRVPSAARRPRDAPVNVLCMKWGTAFGPDWVNRLFAGVRRHLSIPHRFICFTDDARHLHPEIEAFPLPEVRVPVGETDLRWRKLAVFQQPLYDLEGPALFLDLDVVIVGSLDEFFSHPGQFLIIRDDDLALPKPLRWLNPRRALTLRRVGNSSVFRFEIGAHPDVLASFVNDPASAIAAQPNQREQEFLTEQIGGTGELTYWPKEWCVSFKNHCVPLFLASYFRDPAPPPDSKVVIFAGSMKIPDAIARRGSTWYRRLGPSDWLKAAWAEPPAPLDRRTVGR
jgi:hypothetical protein